MNYLFGVDVGGTTVKLGLFDIDGNVIDKWEIPTRTENGGENILPDIASSIEKKISEKGIDKKDVVGTGIGVPGPVDSKGVVHKAVNLGWDEFNLNEKMEALLHMKVKSGNDANVAALGEMWKGAGKGYDSIVMVTLGTGIGGGIIVDGRILCGATGAGGEIGHMHVNDQETEVCGCGNYGCIEQYASATGIARLANRKLEATSKDSILRGKRINAKTVFDAVKEKDELALEVAEEFGKYLGDALSNVADVVNPQAIVIGGGVSKAGNILLEFIEKNFQKNVFHASRGTVFTLATLGNDAGIYGSAKLVIEE